MSRTEPPTGKFLSDIKEIRRRAREHIEAGAVTSAYKADRETVIKLLNEALATEIVCVLRYKRHYFMAQGLTSTGVAAEFLEHANDEQQHADSIAQRITQLDGEPNFNPEGLATRSHAEYKEGKNLVEMLTEDLIAERIAIDTYRDIIRYLADHEPATRQLIEKIMSAEQGHAEELASLRDEMLRRDRPAASPATHAGAALEDMH
jgi:bacterioferritin